MAGIYIHIPFCKKKCNYCNFHFSTNFSGKSQMVEALCKELSLRENFLADEKIQTVYFGGGTPSLLSLRELSDILNTVASKYKLSKEIEITLEANPDDLSKEKLKELHSQGINRLSIGIQSFSQGDLDFMERTHSVSQAERSILEAQEVGFSNLSIDLIYGSPSTSDQLWSKNLRRAIDSKVNHISAYCLTVEPKTKLYHQIKKGQVLLMDESKEVKHYKMLTQMLLGAGFIHYEISNFGKKSYFSKHNTNYWKGIPYLGIGPSAHSFDGNSRQWNVASNKIYVEAIGKNLIPSKKEILSPSNRYNEEVMIGLRSVWGVDLNRLKNYSLTHYNYLISESKAYLSEGILVEKNERLFLPREQWLYADQIASNLFFT